MKFKKSRGVLLGLGYSLIVIAAALFFVIPVIFKEAFQYNAVDAALKGVMALFTMNFINVLYTSIFVLLCLAVAALIIYGIVAIQKKHASHLLILIFSLVSIFASYVIVSIFFLAEVSLNGGAEASFLDSMLKLDGQPLAKILSALVLTFAVISNVLLIVHMFADLFSMVVTDQVNELEQKVDAELEQKAAEMAAEAIASQPAPVAVAPVVEAPVAEEAAEEVAVEEVDAEQERIDAEKEFEARKQRELQLFKECVDSGYFTEYEEIELPEPLEGVDEEPVCEGSVVEERSAFISKRSVHVGYTHD